MNEQELIDVVTLTDDDGNDVRFDHLLTFNYEGKTIIALMPMDPVDNIGDDEVLLMTVENDNGSDLYVPIENEVFLDEAFDRFLELMEELDEDEE